MMHIVLICIEVGFLWLMLASSSHGLATGSHEIAWSSCAITGIQEIPITIEYSKEIL